MSCYRWVVAAAVPVVCAAAPPDTAVAPSSRRPQGPAVHQIESAVLAGRSVSATFRTATLVWDEMLAADRAGAAATSSRGAAEKEASNPGRPPARDGVEAGGAALQGGDVEPPAPYYGMRFPGLDLRTTRVNPPDTMGAIGPAHFLQVLNGRVAAFDKRTGLRLSHVSSTNFFAVTTGAKFDPRVLFDAESGRWVVSAARAGPTGEPWGIVLAVSLTDDPLGAWFQVFFHHADFPDVLHDFPVLGVGPRSISIAACVCGLDGARSLWVFDKAPLLENPPRLGTVTQWDFPSDELTPVPVRSSGADALDLVVGVAALGGAMTVYFIDGPMTHPTLRSRGATPAPVLPLNAIPAPAPGLPAQSGVPTGLFISNSPVYRNRSIWIAFRGEADGRTAIDWLRVDPSTSPPRVVESGQISHPSLHLYLPSVAVNAVNEVMFGFAGSDAQTYIGGYFAGRRPDDAPGATSPIQTLKSGEAIYGTSVEIGRRWGDYTATSVDPTDDLTFWTVQQYAGANGEPNTWGTWIGSLSFGGFDCNQNGVEDICDISCAAGCRPPCGLSRDCQWNAVPDECEPSQDCDHDGVSDACALAIGAAADCNANLLPDPCETGRDCNGNRVPDECDEDCNGNDLPDDCDLAAGLSADCNHNRVPDECDSAPNALIEVLPASGVSLWRSRRNMIQLEFACDLARAPLPGTQLMIAEMLEGGFFGPDLSRSFGISVQSGNVVRIQDLGQTLQHGRWYAIGNIGIEGVQHFSVHFPVLVGDSDGDGTVSLQDLAPISNGVPLFPVPATDRRDINGDGAVMFSDLAAARAHLPTPPPPRPLGH